MEGDGVIPPFIGASALISLVVPLTSFRGEFDHVIAPEDPNAGSTTEILLPANLYGCPPASATTSLPIRRRNHRHSCFSALAWWDWRVDELGENVERLNRTATELPRFLIPEGSTEPSAVGPFLDRSKLHRQLHLVEVTASASPPSHDGRSEL